jgi:endonuclease G
MSNMVAQHGSLNSGKWLRLEQKEADEYANGYDDLWIIDGPIYDRRVPSMNAGTVVPTKLFKIMLIKRDARPVIQAFIFPNRALGGSKLEEYLATVDEIEAATQLDFFPNMKKRTQERLESARPTHLWIVSE